MFFLCQFLSCFFGSNFGMLMQARLPCCTCTSMPLKIMTIRPEAYPDLLRKQALTPHMVVLVPTMAFLVTRLAGVTPLPAAEWPAGVVLAMSFLYLLLVSVGALVAGLELDVLSADPNSSQSRELRQGLMDADGAPSRGQPGSILTAGQGYGPAGMSLDTGYSVPDSTRSGKSIARSRIPGAGSLYGPDGSIGSPSSISKKPVGSSEMGGSSDFLPTAATVDDRFRQGTIPAGVLGPGGRIHAELAGTLSQSSSH